MKPISAAAWVEILINKRPSRAVEGRYYCHDVDSGQVRVYDLTREKIPKNLIELFAERLGAVEVEEVV